MIFAGMISRDKGLKCSLRMLVMQSSTSWAITPFRPFSCCCLSTARVICTEIRICFGMCNLTLVPLVITHVHPFSGCTRTRPGNWLLFVASKWYWKGCLSVILAVERRWGFWIQTHSGDWHLDAVQVICNKVAMIHCQLLLLYIRLLWKIWLVESIQSIHNSLWTKFNLTW